ncbi:glycosyltransferase family 2 protein [Chromobacterium sp. ASV23]|uniref:glycosyltransferase family 2 protein n=1 Tax=Chromobacterium sp. ASV23 TaxID=2795110 RepID=UPI0018ECAFDF|nr:glycosyltransferase family 2 protein [Chromobacterium sp. ASV23]
MPNTSEFLLSIAIPTYNRADFLKINLDHLVKEMRNVAPGLVEIIVSDNGSSDHTPQVVEAAIREGLAVRYIRNVQDIGSDANIAQCFNEAKGKYVQIMGDDDLYLKDKLAELLNVLKENDYGVVCMKSYGYEKDYVQEFPGGGGEVIDYSDTSSYLFKIGALISFISACVINKEVQAATDANQFCGTNLVQVNLVIQAIISKPHNAFIGRYMLACKRNNSGGYDFSEVFVERIFRILDSFRPKGLSENAIKAFGKKMLISYYPFNLLRQRLSRAGDLKAAYRRFHERFGGSPLFYIWVAPILKLPRPLAILWAWVTVLLGRILTGDLRRGIHFAINRLKG